jgi:hypothetical protein
MTVIISEITWAKSENSDTPLYKCIWTVACPESRSISPFNVMDYGLEVDEASKQMYEMWQKEYPVPLNRSWSWSNVVVFDKDRVKGPTAAAWDINFLAHCSVLVVGIVPVWFFLINGHWWCGQRRYRHWRWSRCLKGSINIVTFCPIHFRRNDRYVQLKWWPTTVLM